MKNIEKNNIETVLKQYIESSFKGDWENYTKIWHPEAKKFGIGNNNLYILTSEEIKKHNFDEWMEYKEQFPDHQMQMEVVNIEQIDITEDFTATAKMAWKMIENEDVFRHFTYFLLTKQEGNWLIVSALDYGCKEKSE